MIRASFARRFQESGHWCDDGELAAEKPGEKRRQRSRRLHEYSRDGVTVQFLTHVCMYTHKSRAPTGFVTTHESGDDVEVRLVRLVRLVRVSIELRTRISRRAGSRDLSERHAVLARRSIVALVTCSVSQVSSASGVVMQRSGNTVASWW